MSAPNFGALVNLAHKHGYNGPVCSWSAADDFTRVEAEVTGESASRNRFSVILPRSFRGLPEPRYIVPPLIPDCAVTLLYGAPGSFKSFIELDLLASTAANSHAFGKFKTVQGDTVLCAGEGPHAIARKRYGAWAHARQIANPDAVPFGIIPAVPLVSDPDEVKALLAAIKASGLKPRIVGIDTAALAMGGLDENDARAAGLLLRASHCIRDEFGCAVVVVHHEGKDPDRGARGSSALMAGVDAAFRVAREPNTLAVRLCCTKMKDADEPEDVHLLGRHVFDSLVFDSATEDDSRRATGKQVGIRQTDVAAALKAFGACPGGANEWNEKAGRGGTDTRNLATLITRARNGADGAPSEPTQKEIDVAVAALNKGARDGGPFVAYVVRERKGGRQWAIAPGEISHA